MFCIIRIIGRALESKKKHTIPKKTGKERRLGLHVHARVEIEAVPCAIAVQRDVLHSERRQVIGVERVEWRV